MMICYRDKTFCSFWETCEDGVTCHRALTKEVLIGAETEEYNICQFSLEPECWIGKDEPSETNTSLHFHL